MAKYTKSVTTYTKKHKSQIVNDGVIYENDYSTLTQNTLPIAGATTYFEGNFRIVTNPNSNNEQKKYNSGDWTTPTNGNGDEFWTLDEIENSDGDIPIIIATDTTDEKVILKNNYNYLSSFCYFGSLYEMIRSSFEDIVLKFPASLWIRPYNNNFGSYDLVNDFDIDLFTDVNSSVDDNIRIMYSHFKDYEIIRTEYELLNYPIINQPYNQCSNVEYKSNYLKECKYSITNFNQTFRYVTPNGIVSVPPSGNNFLKELDEVIFLGQNISNCGGNNIKIILKYHYYDENDGDPCILKNITTDVWVDGVQETIPNINSNNNDPLLPDISYHIKPNINVIENFFLKLNDFQKIILNRYTNPRYTSIFKIPKEDENGSYYVDQKFTWKTPDGWNLDIKSIEYISFIDLLTKVSIEIDERRADNLYGRMTHDAIKNMDNSISREILDENEQNDFVEGGNKIEKVIRMWGVMLDEIKKYIDGLGCVNNVSYDEKDNLPDVYLKDFLSLKGWVLTSPIINKIRNSISNNLYYGYLDGYTSKEMERDFYRRLLINSNHILRNKGTKNGLEMLMNIFGVDRNNWSIDEYVYVSTGVISRENEGTTYGDYKEIDNRGYFTQEETFDIIDINRSTLFTLNGNTYDLFNYPLALNEEKMQEDLHNLCVNKEYTGKVEVCPTCHGVGTISDTSGNFVFDAKCPTCLGSGDIKTFIGVPFFKGNTDRLYYQQNGGWYQETQSYLKSVDTIIDLININKVMLRLGDIYYVHVIPTPMTPPTEPLTNYYVLVDMDKYNTIDGWVNIPEDKFDVFMYPEIDPFITVSVNDLISIVDINQGNNPHTGYGNYDFGMNYLQYFSATYDKDTEECQITPYNDTYKDYLKGSCGLFKYTIDNSDDCIKDSSQYDYLKGWGFIIKEVKDSKKSWYVDNNNILKTDDTYNILTNRYISECPKDPLNPEPIITTNIRNIEYDIINNNDITKNQIINTKNIILTFKGDEDDIQYFNEVILPYIEQMIPSTSIFSVITEQI